MIAPLPVRTRVFGGEGLPTYRRRHADNNLSNVPDIERYVEEQTGQRLSRSSRDLTVIGVWRELGALHERTFTEPDVIEGNWVTTRDLCRRCSGSQQAHGRRPDIGLVCIRHRRWLGQRQIDIARYPPALTAERHFRRVLVPKGVLFDSPAMRLANECVKVGSSGVVLSQRQGESGLADAEAVLYPETVALARLLTRASFLDFVCDPGQPGRARRTLVEQEVARILPEREDSEPWRAVARVWTMVTRLADAIRDARLVSGPVEDTEYNVLRYSGFLDAVQPLAGQANRDHRVQQVSPEGC